MEIRYNENLKRFEAISRYEEKDILKSAGFWWDAKARLWYTNSIDVTCKIKDNLSEESKLIIENKRIEQDKAINESRAIDTSENLECKEGLNYYNYQKAGISFSKNKKNVIIADEMGLGKTIQAIGLINNENFSKVLIVTPAFLKLNWKNELEKWLIKEYNINIIKKDFAFNNDNENNIYIINYELLEKFLAELQKTEFDLIVFDEAHYMKNHKAKRTKAGLSLKSKKRIFLTGTPILNRPIELFPILNSCNLEIAKNWFYYAKRYCNAYKSKWGWVVDGSSNSEELNKILRENVMIRRLKKDVLTELADKVRQIVMLEENGDNKIINKEREFLKEYENKTKSIKEYIKKLRAEKKEDSDDYKQKIKELRDCFVEFTKIAEIRHQVALTKVDKAVEFAINTIDDSGSVVVFTHHKDVAEQINQKINEAGYKSKCITGDQTIEDRQAIVDDFQSEKIDCVVLTMNAGGLGITLTRSSNVIFVELDWTPATIQQAEDRLHRIGQKENVLVKYLIYDGTVDSMLAKKMESKEEIIEAILD